MILVLLGTQNNSFFRLLDKIEDCINNKLINEEVIVQAGYTSYTSNNMKILDFISETELNKLVEKANLIITHGGVGSIINSLKLNKKVIAVSRLAKYNEHVNDHQTQIVKSLNDQGYIIGLEDVNLLGDTLKRVADFVPEKYISNTENILKIISNYIDNN